jgi:hypothetical protein
LTAHPISGALSRQELEPVIPCPQCHHPCKNLFGVHIHQSFKHPEVIANNCYHCQIVLTIENQRPHDRKANEHICRDCYWKRRNRCYWKGNVTHKSEYRELKIEMIQAYGSQCLCCGENNIEFLCIDHIYADRSQERTNGAKNRSRTGGDLYRYLKKLGWPKDRYRLLCHNCNFSLAAYGYCPHQPQLELFSKPTKLVISL